MFRQYTIGLILAALSVTGFASTFIFGSALTKECGVSPTVLAFIRFVIAGGAMLAAGCASRSKREKLFSLRRQDWLTLLWLGPVGTSMMAWCVFMGCARVSAANASMADAITPLMIFAVAALKTRKLEVHQLFGLVCGFVGALLVIQVVNANGLALEAYSAGDIYILLAAATWAVYTVYGRDFVNRFGSVAFSTWTMLIGAATIGIVLPFGDFVWPSTVRAWTLTAMLGLVSTLIPFWTWNAAQKYLPMTILGISAYFTPVMAVALALLILGEPATPMQWLGTIFIIASAAVESKD